MVKLPQQVEDVIQKIDGVMAQYPLLTQYGMLECVGISPVLLDTICWIPRGKFGVRIEFAPRLMFEFSRRMMATRPWAMVLSLLKEIALEEGCIHESQAVQGLDSSIPFPRFSNAAMPPTRLTPNSLCTTQTE